MRILSLILLILLAACGSNYQRPEAAEDQETIPDAQSIVDASKRLFELQKRAQPNSWDVSFEESMKKKNPLIPAPFVLNSGIPSNQGDGGLWNCIKLRAGRTLCDIDSSRHMSAEYVDDGSGGEIIGQVVINAPENKLLTVSCMQSGELEITTSMPNISNSDKANPIKIGFDNEPSVEYEVDSYSPSTVDVTDTKRLLAKLMVDYMSVEIRSFPVEGQAEISTRFIVRNFPKAWKVACGWQSQYDPETGIK